MQESGCKHPYRCRDIAKLLVTGIAVVLLFTGCGPPDKIQTGGSTRPSEIEAPPMVKEGWMPSVWKEFLFNGPTNDHLPDFSRAGYLMGEQPIPEVQGPVFDVTDAAFGAIADDTVDDTAAIQSAIETAGAAGGGVVFLPRGRYEIHQTPEAPFLRIAHNHVILRGQGSGPSGTILHLGAPAPDMAIRRLGSVAAEQDARHFAAVAVMGPEDKRELARYTGDVMRGQQEVPVSDSSRMTPGQPVFIEFYDPLISTLNPDPKKADLAAQLTRPFQLVKSQTDTFGEAAQRISWIVKVEEILDRQAIRLAKPARFNQWIRYQPRLFSFRGLRGVGIEHLRIDSSWPGGYRHHKPFIGKKGIPLRSAREQDYLWAGLWFSYACDGWVRNVIFNNLTQGIMFSHCADVTVADVQFEGVEGHAGITIGQSNGILVEGAQFFSRRVHPVTLTMMASGNVITDCEIHYEGRNPSSGTDAVIDFHGLFPYENLFDNLRGFYVCPGGDLSVLPHGGVRNVFWNIQTPQKMECYTHADDDEFMRTYAFKSTSAGTPQTMFEHLPEAFYIGLYRKGAGLVTIAGKTHDRRNGWMTVEGLNRSGIGIPSLYQAQKKGRGLFAPP